MNINADPFARGFLMGFKRVNVKKLPDDFQIEGKAFTGGYVLGFLVKAALIVGAAHYGITLPA